MQCFFQKPLTDEQLSAAVFGEVDPEVSRHLAACKFCRLQFADAQQFEARLARGVHPTVQQLADFRVALLGEQDREAVARHVAQCQPCQQELATLERLAADLPVAPSPAVASVSAPALPRHIKPSSQLGRSAPRWANVRREQSARIIPQPAAGAQTTGIGYLGSSSNVVTVQATSARILLTMESISDGVLVSGQLITMDEDEQAAWTGAILTLTHDQTTARTMTLLNDLGEFTCPPMPAGTARLRIRSLVGQVIVLSEFQLAET